MRKIKFRMWDTKASKYFTSQAQVIECLKQQVVGMFDHVENGSVFEQFTGLYDCTTWDELTEPEREEWTRTGNMPSEWMGREIYEGDIVKNGAHEFLVSFCNSQGGFQPFINWDEEFVYTECKPAKIIGNIHERA